MQTASAPPPWHRTLVALYLLLLTLATIAFFVIVTLSGQRDGLLNNLTEGVFLAIQSSAMFLGLARLRRAWRAAAPPLRWFTIAICAGLGLDAVGAIVWLTYNAFGVAVPYPSLADIFYVASDSAWVIGVSLIFWALDTNVRDEVGPFIDILGATWSLLIVVLSLIGLSAESVNNLLKLILDIIYPFFSALACALLGSILLGPQLRRLNVPWRWLIVILYASWLLNFFGDIGFSITTSLGLHNLSFSLLYYDGGPIDAIYAASNLIACWAVAFLPLSERLFAEQESDLPEFGFPPSMSRPG